MNASYFFAATLLISCTLHASDNGVHPYNPSQDKAAIRDLTLANIYSLTTWYAADLSNDKGREKACDAEIMAHLNPATTKVLIKDGQLKGFINYSRSLPWYRKLVNSPIGENVVLHHLAVDSQERKKGYGKVLVQTILDECKSQQVNRVSLWTNGYELDPFYRKKLGFNLVRATKMLELNYALRLRPHPMLEGIRYVAKMLRK